MSKARLIIEGCEIVTPPNFTIRFDGEFEEGNSVSGNYFRRDGEAGEIVIRPLDRDNSHPFPGSAAITFEDSSV